MISRSFRVASVLLLAGLLLLSLAAPALAHGRGSDATNFRSRVVTPPDIPGVTWEVIGPGEYLTARNDGDAEIVVFGYDGPQDPYLRIGPEGVLRNANSTATYLNEARFAEDAPAPPATAGPGTKPDWVKVSDEPFYAWTDHRIHWEAPNTPPYLLQSQEATEVIAWVIPVRHQGEAQQVEGVLEYVPAGPWWPYLVAALVLTLPALLGLRAGSPTEPLLDWVRRAARPAAAVLGVVSLANITQLLDDFLAIPQPFGDSALKGLQTALFIAIGLFGAVRAWQGRDGAFTALGVGSVAIFVGQGILYWSALTSSQATSLFPPAVSRTVIALSLAQLVPVGLVALWGNGKLARAGRDDVEPQPEAATIEPGESGPGDAAAGESGVGAPVV